jgi:hypothetical protein
MHRRRRAQARTYRPHLETLEARDVPAALPWTPLQPPVALDTVPALRADRFDPSATTPQVVVTGAVRHPAPAAVPSWTETRTAPRSQSSFPVLASLQRGLSRFLDGLDALGQQVADSPAAGGLLTCSLAATALGTALEVGRRQAQSSREEERTGIWCDVDSWLGDAPDFTPSRAA